MSCREPRPPEAGFAGAPVALCTFELDAGVTFTYRGSWAAAGHETPWFDRSTLEGDVDPNEHPAAVRPRCGR